MKDWDFDWGPSPRECVESGPNGCREYAKVYNPELHLKLYIREVTGSPLLGFGLRARVRFPSNTVHFSLSDPLDFAKHEGETVTTTMFAYKIRALGGPRDIEGIEVKIKEGAVFLEGENSGNK